MRQAGVSTMTTNHLYNKRGGKRLRLGINGLTSMEISKAVNKRPATVGQKDRTQCKAIDKEEDS
jgi:hypothetical protein